MAEVKKQTAKRATDARVIPRFASEAEEADWWYKNRNAHGKHFLAAVKNGDAKVLTKEKLHARIAASKKTGAKPTAPQARSGKQ
jgi:hypothetical protein